MRADLAIKRVDKRLALMGLGERDCLGDMLSCLRQLNSSGCRRIMVPFVRFPPSKRIRPDGTIVTVFEQMRFARRDIEVWTANKLLASLS